jgi:hypothetical protein
MQRKNYQQPCIDCKKTRIKPAWALCLDDFIKSGKECTVEDLKKNPRCPCPPKIQTLGNQSIYHVQQSKKQEQAKFVTQQRKWRKAIYDKVNRNYIFL